MTFYLQIYETSFLGRSNDNAINVIYDYPQRGYIFDRNGKLLVCMSQLNKIKEKPEAVQLYQSIISYMNSTNFNPNFQLTPEKLIALFNNN